jgi:hypothetical protein
MGQPGDHQAITAPTQATEDKEEWLLKMFAPDLWTMLNNPPTMRVLCALTEQIREEMKQVIARKYSDYT